MVTRTYPLEKLQEAFDIEYWLLEEAKLQRMPKEQPLSRKVALITGAGGGIGKAIALRAAQDGARLLAREPLRHSYLPNTLSCQRLSS